MFQFLKKSDSSVDTAKDEEIKSLRFKIAQLEGICSAFPDPYYIRDMDYNIVLWPDSIVKLTGYSASEAKKLKCYDMFKACVCPPKSQCPTQGCVQNRQFLRDVAVDVYHKDGSTVHCLVSNAGVYDDKGKPIAAIEVVKDNTKIKNGIDSIADIIKSIEQMADDLADTVAKVDVVSEKVKEKARESMDDIKIGVQNSAIVSKKSRQSSKHAESVQSKMKAINDSMRSSVEKVSALREKSETIIQFVKVIQEISFQTNLLAINASIEAAHAGEAGKGFMVVADAIRGLSKQSKESAQRIESTIETVIGLVQETSESLGITEKDIEIGSKNIAELLDFVGEIDDATNKLNNNIRLTEDAAVATSNLSDEQAAVMTEIDKTSGDMADIAHSLAAEFEKVMKAVQRQDMG
ncbi:MAG: methyl-accepting chemotaxis protein [Chitinispirillales bacterium]|jgi:PAS domain S-box-containing protein|nr:methyl-accepting chemotaxis protein [Chitinispirillales bacterium]